MTLFPLSHITTVKDVETFFHHLVTERKVNFHPDNMFEDYVSCEGGINTFTLEECAVYNRLMDESFKVCEKEGADIYEIGMNELLPWVGQKIIGKEIRIVSMNGEPQYTGKTGIVDRIDDEGQLHGSWGGLAIQPEKDKFEVL